MDDKSYLEININQNPDQANSPDKTKKESIETELSSISSDNDNQKDPKFSSVGHLDVNQQKKKQEENKYKEVNNTNTLKEKITVSQPPPKTYYETQGIFSRFLFLWAYKAIKAAGEKELKADDLEHLGADYNAKDFSKPLDEYWYEKKYKDIEKHALMKSLLRINIKDIIFIIFELLIVQSLSYISVIMIKNIIDYFDTQGREEEKELYFPLYVMAIIYLVLYGISYLIYPHYDFDKQVLAKKMAGEIACFTYKKILSMALSSFEKKSTQGEIINFIQVDAQKLANMINVFPEMLIFPFLIIAYLVMLFEFFGYMFIPGIVIMLVILGINFKIFQGFEKSEQETLKRKDIRMKLITETFDNIKLLKLYNWENEFQKRIMADRDDELIYIKKSLDYSSGNISLFWLNPSMVSVITIGFYQYFTENMKISTMLIGITIFNNIQEPIRALPDAIINTIQAFISMGRIEKFIRQPERDESVLKQKINQNEKEKSEKSDPNDEYALRIENGCFSWGGNFPSEEEEKDKDKDKKDNDQNDKDKKNKPPSKSDDKTKKKIDTSINQSSLISEDTDSKSDSSLTEDELNSSNKSKHRIIQNPQLKIPPGVDYNLVLEDINLKIKKGEIVGIIGKVGSGKSSLIQAFLNNLILLNPKDCDGIHINGTISYVSQLPWIQNETIKNNILFFKEYDQRKYERALKLSQLQADLEILDGGDQTEIGEKGVNLSGGQKVRISLARAIYSDSDIFLLDDPISALDANIGKKVMENCIIRELRDKTRVIATNAIHYLKYMDRIIYLENGRISWEGNYENLEKQEFFAVLNKMTNENKENEKEQGEGGTRKRRKSIEDTFKEMSSGKNNEKKLVKITAEEDREYGRVKCSVYSQYFNYLGGICYIILIGFVMLLWQSTKVGSNMFLGYWSRSENATLSRNAKWGYFGIYGSLTLLGPFFVFLRVFLLARGAVKLDKNLHNDMLVKLIKAPINLFHDTVPRGQIFNRLSSDLELLNESIYNIGNFFVATYTIIGAIFVCTYYFYYSVFFLPIFVIIGLIATNKYLRCSRQLSRLEAICKSPILNIIGETVPGIPTILSFEKKEFYLEKFYKAINQNLKVYFYLRGIMDWFIEQFDIYCLFFNTYLMVVIVLFEEKFSPQGIGLMITYSKDLTEGLAWGFLTYATLEIALISMERCLKFTTIPGEKKSYIFSDKTLVKEAKWPYNGKIEFQKYSVKYRPNTEIVLKNLNFTIKSQEKVGIVGRTGCGKSTICLCLFRILEPHEGKILIDDIDISTIGLDLLRQSLTIIPQDPCLMEGTLRYNIDPLNKNTDVEIIKVLEEIGFEIHSESLSQDEGQKEEKDKNILEKHIEQKGDNLSVGEKQLVCIARAILRKTKIILMDEATANIDIKTEEKIQKALMENLKDSTIITIAHRIKTIINYQKILVLDYGNIIEYDSPENLLKNPQSIFSQLYNKSVI